MITSASFVSRSGKAERTASESGVNTQSRHKVMCVVCPTFVRPRGARPSSDGEYAYSEQDVDQGDAGEDARCWRECRSEQGPDLVGRRNLFKSEPLCAVPTRSSRSRAQSRMADSKSAPAIRETLRARERRLRKTRRTPGMPYGAMPMVPPASQQ